MGYFAAPATGTSPSTVRTLEPRRLLAGIGVDGAFAARRTVIEDLNPTVISDDYTADAVVQGDAKLVVFNYDGIVSGDDYSAVDFNIAAQGPPL